jgi:hypothetical protein
LWRRSKNETSRPRGAEDNGTAAPERGALTPEDEEEDPIVMLHATLDKIERETLPAAAITQRIDDRRLVARHRRKDLERRGQKIMPEADIDPDDTGETNLVVSV